MFCCSPCLDADFLVADSMYLKVAFGVSFKMLLFNPLVLSTKDLSRNLKLTASNSSLEEDFPTGRVNSSCWRKDLSRAGPTSGIRAWREPLLKKLYFHLTMTSQNPSQTYPMPSPSVSSFTFPSTTEPVFSAFQDVTVQSSSVFNERSI
ncbi:hypothetical protein Tco_1167495 [Tanacetum coccineum]